MFVIPSNYRNVNQNNFNIFYFTPVRMAKMNKTIDNKCRRGCGGKEASFTVGEVANQPSYSGNQCGEFSEN